MARASCPTPPADLMARSRGLVMSAASHIVVRDATPFVIATEPRTVNNGAMSLSAQIRRWREYRELTQEQLAHACGWQGQSRIGNYETEGPNGRLPRAPEIPVLADALGVTIDELYFGTPGREGVSQ